MSAKTVPSHTLVTHPSAPRYVIVPGVKHNGHFVLYSPATDDLAWDALCEGYPVELPAAAEARIREDARDLLACCRLLQAAPLTA